MQMRGGESRCYHVYHESSLCCKTPPSWNVIYRIRLTSEWFSVVQYRLIVR